MFGLFGDLFGSKKRKVQEAHSQQRSSASNVADVKDTGVFSMRIENVFNIMGRGVVVTGKIEQGVVRLHDTVIIKNGSMEIRAEVTGIEVFKQTLDSAQAGQSVGLMFKDVQKFDPVPGGRVTSYHKIKS